VTDNGDDLFWQTIGDPDQWTVVVINGRSYRVETFDNSISGFLAGVICGSIRPQFMPQDLCAKPAFRGHGDRSARI
jgi:hypothetical protein